MKVIVGLGNPGGKYEKSRHNIGFMFLDFLNKENQIWKFNKRFNALIIEQGNVILLKPMTFMNNSGQSVRAILDYYNFLPKKLKLFLSKDADLSEILTVVHDDLDIDFPKFKKSVNASSAGHNGVESIIRHLKTKNFNRIRLGINNDFRKSIPGDKFVLQSFSKDELDKIDSIFSEIAI